MSDERPKDEHVGCGLLCREDCPLRNASRDDAFMAILVACWFVLGAIFMLMLFR